MNQNPCDFARVTPAMPRAYKVFFELVYGSRELVATMKNLLAFFLLAPLALLAQENTNYDPDSMATAVTQ